MLLHALVWNEPGLFAFKTAQSRHKQEDVDCVTTACICKAQPLTFKSLAVASVTKPKECTPTDLLALRIAQALHPNMHGLEDVPLEV